MVKNALVGQCVNCGRTYIVDGFSGGVCAHAERVGRKDFRVGDLIANARDPLKHDFVCGSITSFGANGFWVTLPGNSGVMQIARESVIDLLDVLMEVPPTVRIIADRRYISDTFKQLVAGVVMDAFSTHERYCVKTIHGSAFITREDAVPVMDAVRMIHGPCPRNRA